MAIPVGGYFWARRTYETMMFAPRASDFDRMGEALRKRFGGRVRLLQVPMVDRDTNGYVGIVAADPAFPRSTFLAQNEFLSTFSFRSEGETILCFLSTSEERVSDLEARYRRLSPRITPFPK